MSVRYWARLGFDIARLSLAELLERSSRWAVTKLMDAPGDGVAGFAPAAAPATEDNLRFLSEEELLEMQVARMHMRAQRPVRPTPAEDNPPNAPLVGSIEWRNQQRYKGA